MKIVLILHDECAEEFIPEGSLGILEDDLEPSQSHNGSICPCCCETTEPEELALLLPEEVCTSDVPFTQSSSDSSDESETVAKVFRDCPVTPSASNLQYTTRHNLTQEAVADLLKLLSIHALPLLTQIIVLLPKEVSFFGI